MGRNRKRCFMVFCFTVSVAEAIFIFILSTSLSLGLLFLLLRAAKNSFPLFFYSTFKLSWLFRFELKFPFSSSLFSSRVFHILCNPYCCFLIHPISFFFFYLKYLYFTIFFHCRFCFRHVQFLVSFTSICSIFFSFYVGQHHLLCAVLCIFVNKSNQIDCSSRWLLVNLLSPAW